MPPSSHGELPKTQLEREFLKAAEASGKMPSRENRKKARKAWDKLPANSPFKKYKFEG
jgi:hypothetical protein